MLERLRSAGIDASVAKDIQTTEQDKTGKEKNIKADFLSFKSPEDAFMAYLMFIDTTKSDGKRRYGEALDQAKTAKEYLQKIKESGYATAKDYVSSIDSIASGFGVDLGNISRDDDRLASN
jgi:flagellum-specific peptidoglycan hydrolase FlgJ